MSTPSKFPLESAENAVLDALSALDDVHPDPAHPIARTALKRTRDALVTASNSLHLAKIATATNAASLARATSRSALSAGHGRAAL